MYDSKKGHIYVQQSNKRIEHKHKFGCVVETSLIQIMKIFLCISNSVKSVERMRFDE